MPFNGGQVRRARRLSLQGCVMKKTLYLAAALLMVASLHAGLSKAAALTADQKLRAATGDVFAVFEHPKDVPPAFSDSDLYLKQHFSVGEATPVNFDALHT